MTDADFERDLEPALAERFRARLTELARIRGCAVGDFDSAEVHVLKNLLLDGWRVSEGRKMPELWDPDAETPVRTAQEQVDSQPQTLDTVPGFKIRRQG